MSSSTGGVRFQDPTLGNASPWIYVWNMWSLSASTGFIALRLWSRRAAFGLDDLLNSLAFAAAVASNASIFAALTAGLGNPHGILDEAKCSSIVVTSVCLLFVTDFLSKCSTLFLTRRVITHGAAPDKTQRLACDILLGTCLVWVIIALGLLGSDCTNQCSLDNGGVCPSGHRVHAIIAVSIFLELAIFTLPCWLFFNLQMALVHKVTTIGLFALRFPLIAFSCVYMGNFHGYMQSVDAGSANIGPGIYWQLVLLACVVVAPSLQALKKSAELFNTSGAQVTSSARGSDYRLQDLSANSASRTRKMSRQLSTTISRNVSRKLMQKSESNTELRPDATKHETSILHSNGTDSEQASWASGNGKRPRRNADPKMVIRQQTDVEVISS